MRPVGRLCCLVALVVAVSMTWDYAPDEVIRGFTVYEQAGCQGAWISLATLPSSSRTYTDNAVVPGQRYCWRVTAYTSEGESLSSNVLDYTVPGGCKNPRRAKACKNSK